MEPPRLTPGQLSPATRVLARWMFSPRTDWPGRRRRLELAQRLPGATPGTQIRERSLGGVRAEEVTRGAPACDVALLYLHGGGYCVGSPRSFRAVTSLLATGFAGPVLALDYRLAPEHPHPAALGDVQAAWAALTDSIAPARIVLAGDSAGAGLALALALRLRDRAAPLPAALGLIAPWLDLGPDLAGTRRPSAQEVVLSLGLMRAFARAYLAGAGAEAGAGGDGDGDRTGGSDAGADAASPLVSPLRGELRGLPPLLVSTSEHDLLRDDATRLVARAREAGVQVSVDSLAHLWHDPFTLARLLAEPAGTAPVRFGADLRALVASAGAEAESRP